jgi:hypothetical protein
MLHAPDMYEVNSRIHSKQFGPGTILESTGKYHPRFGYGYMVLFDRRPVRNGKKMPIYVFHDEIEELKLEPETSCSP